ncbi:MAG: hypothetical protein ACP6IU_14165 [Candidatus Asgardarchaeia archaeon]
MYTTIKIRKETARRLAKLLRELISEYNRKLSYDDLINYLIDRAIVKKGKQKDRQKELSDAAKRILKMMEMPVEGAGREDFIEYDYNDVD